MTSSAPAALASAPRAARHLGRFFLGLWFVAMLAVGATLLARHMIPLPSPDGGKELASAIDGLRRPGDVGRWLVVHVLYGECRCSQRIVEHLMSGERPPDVAEHVLLVGADHAVASALASRGFAVHDVGVEELGTRYHVEAAPLLVVAAPDGKIRYVGGYTDRKQAADIRDVAIVHRARTDEALPVLPLYGCAISEELRARLNPLALP